MSSSRWAHLPPTIAAPLRRDPTVRGLRLLLLVHEGAPDRPIASRLSTLRPRASTGSRAPIELPRPPRLPGG